ncbi:MAG TPA: tripartite tricarboxylate transporter substrate-binding protein, partial [Burkholderiaceae bacterium]|nr:tripartite tricarboxylate transporter substrate-binding protein [Burkholderiaceae bacterium]
MIVTHRASPRGQHRRISRSTSPEYAIGPLAYAPFLYSKLSYDVQKDLTPVILMGGQPFVLGVSAASGIASVK